MGLVYTIRNIINNKRYIGLTMKDNYGDRLKKHIYNVEGKSKFHIHRAIRKYGWENFTHTAWYVSDDLEFLKKFETAKIKEFDTFNNGYNMTSGGECGGAYFTENTLIKLRECRKGKKHWNYGKHHSEETKKKMCGPRPSLLGNIHCFGHIPWNKGKKVSQITGAKHPNAREIILIHPNGVEEYFGCIIEASKKYNIDRVCLSLVAQYKRKHTKGFKCRYIKENN